MKRRLSTQEWAYEIRRALRVREEQRRRMQKAKYAYAERFLGRLIVLPVLLGIGAMTAMVLLYGWREFFKFLLSWVVSLTLVAMGAYYLWKYYERKL